MSGELRTPRSHRTPPRCHRNVFTVSTRWRRESNIETQQTGRVKHKEVVQDPLLPAANPSMSCRAQMTPMATVSMELQPLQRSDGTWVACPHNFKIFTREGRWHMPSIPTLRQVSMSLVYIVSSRSVGATTVKPYFKTQK